MVRQERKQEYICPTTRKSKYKNQKGWVLQRRTHFLQPTVKLDNTMLVCILYQSFGMLVLFIHHDNLDMKRQLWTLYICSQYMQTCLHIQPRTHITQPHTPFILSTPVVKSHCRNPLHTKTNGNHNHTPFTLGLYTRHTIKPHPLSLKLQVVTWHKHNHLFVE